MTYNISGFWSPLTNQLLVVDWLGTIWNAARVCNKATAVHTAVGIYAQVMELSLGLCDVHGLMANLSYPKGKAC